MSHAACEKVHSRSLRALELVHHPLGRRVAHLQEHGEGIFGELFEGREPLRADRAVDDPVVERAGGREHLREAVNLLRVLGGQDALFDGRKTLAEWPK